MFLLDVAIDLHRRDADLSHYDLWLRYIALGGMNFEFELEALLAGALAEDSEHDYDVIVRALNERFVELGECYRVPYFEERA